MTGYGEALEVAVQAAAGARAILLAECARPNGPRGDPGHCPADDECEWLIRRQLLDAFPAWGYLGEETGKRAAEPGETHVWVVDPNDGTRPMQQGHRGHAVSVALIRSGVPVLGVVWSVDAPDDDGDLLVWAEGCGPLRRNGVPLAPRQWPAALAAEHIILVSQGGDRHPMGHIACAAPARYLSCPSIAYRLARVAGGDAVATLTIQSASAWDVAAGHALLRGAGGSLVDTSGSHVTYASDGSLVPRMFFGGTPALLSELAGRSWQRAMGTGFGQAAPPADSVPLRPRAGWLVHDAEVLQRAHGCMLGQLAGDSLGALVEFRSAASIERLYPDGGPRLLADEGPHRIAAGQPTDDSEMALMLARSIVQQGGPDAEASAAAYASWFHGWVHAAEPTACTHLACRPFDVGETTSRALSPVSPADVALRRAALSARAAASTASQANGGLMRISPLGIWGAFRDPGSVAAAARQDATLTHPNPVCQDASALLAVTIAAAIRQKLSPDQAFTFAIEWARDAGLSPPVQAAVAAAGTDCPADYLSHQGYVLLALQNAFYMLVHAASLEEGVVQTVRCGGDTDTNAAICGALLGAVHGRRAVPPQWARLVLSCRPLAGTPGISQPRPAVFWPVDALVLSERLLLLGQAQAAC